MSLIVYLPGEDDDHGTRLMRALAPAVPNREMEVYHSYPDLVHRLQRLSCDVRVTVLLAASRENLGDIVQLRDYLLDMKSILVLPDDSPETIAKAHTLRPRFISWLDRDFTEVSLVLRKMLELYDIRH